MISMKKSTSLIAALIVITGIAITISLTQVLISLFIDYLTWFSNNALYGMIIFILLYIVFGIIALPASFHKYLAGVIYGFGPGILIAYVGSMLGAIAPFLLGKKWMNPYARKALSKYPTLSGLEQEIVDKGTNVVALTRISLVIPYGVLNYAYGATEVKFRNYLVGNLAMIVPSIMYAWW
ncbi:MAG: VTT domain-containing protein, partial [Candidatus Poseidoniaceae archaeon]|nr:VTT domain-containing protein [Candidatus Poseidoniaceae archaeon]